MFAALEEKLIVALIFVLAVGAAIYAYHLKSAEVTNLQIAAVAQKVQNADLTNTVKVDNAVDKVSNDVSKTLAKNTNIITAKHDAIVSDTEKKVQQSEDTFHNTIPAPTQQQLDEQQTKISTILISAIWTQYCTGVPEDKACLKS